MKRLILVMAVFAHFIGFGSTDESWARDTFIPDAQWQPGLYLSLTGGFQIPIASIRQGYLSDNLIGFQGQGFWWQPIDLHWNFSERFGIGTIYRVMPVGNWEKKFINDVEKRYPNYFVQTTDRPNTNIRSAKQVLMGMSVNHAWGKWFLQPQLQMGITVIRQISIGASAKENGTHQLYSVFVGQSQTFGTNNSVGLTMATGAKLGRFLGNNWGVFGEINLFSFEMDITYGVSTTDQLTGAITTENHRYNRLTSGVLVSVGVFRSVITW